MNYEPFFFGLLGQSLGKNSTMTTELGLKLETTFESLSRDITVMDFAEIIYTMGHTIENRI